MFMKHRAARSLSALSGPPPVVAGGCLLSPLFLGRVGQVLDRCYALFKLARHVESPSVPAAVR